MTKLKISNDQENGATFALMSVIIGLLMAVSGFIWSQYTAGDPNYIGSNVAAGLLIFFGLVIAAAGLLTAAVIVANTSIKTSKKSKKRKK
jgi:uncharacterized membrane protein